MAESNRRPSTILMISIVVTLLLYTLPLGRLLGHPLILLSTLAHEMGHGIMAILTGGSLERLELFSDASGAIDWRGEGAWWQRALVAAGGLLGPAIVGAFLLTIGRYERLNRSTLVCIGFILVLAEIFLIRNLFAFIFVALVLLSFAAVGLWGTQQQSQWFSYFVGVQLCLSSFSRSDYLFVEKVKVQGDYIPSDVAQMADALSYPYWYCGIACGLVSVLCIAIGVVAVFRS